MRTYKMNNFLHTKNQIDKIPKFVTVSWRDLRPTLILFEALS